MAGPAYSRAYVDVTVVAPPLPVTRGDCRNDGWRGYGVFKKLGECVGFVSSGGKSSH